jgi:HD-GYP domain-containing protein (c-di-GMP phosphodiesterase class II)
MRQQIQSRTQDDRSLELVLTIGIVGLMSLVGFQIKGSPGALLTAIFGAVVFVQGRLASRNHVIHVPVVAIAAGFSPLLLPVLLVGMFLLIPLGTRHGIRRVFALFVGECAGVFVAYLLAGQPGWVLVTPYLVVRMGASMLVSRFSGMPLDIGAMSGLAAWLSGGAVSIVAAWVMSAAPSVEVGCMQFVVIAAVWLGVMRAYLAAGEEFSAGLIGLGNLLGYAHPYTGGHSRRVGYLARETGRRLGIPEWRLDEVVHAALLHDIGKLAVDERILEKPSKLTDEEFAVIKTHPAIGEAIVSEVLEHKPLAKWIRHHHERMDGRGYPDNLPKSAIPIESRLIAVLDAYDAMTGTSADGHRRLYRDPVSSEKAIEELRRCSGTQFDPRVVKAFEAVLNHGRGGVL